MGEPGQPEWFENLLQGHYRRLLAFACGLLGDMHQADDVVQEVFVAAWRAAQQQKAPFAATLDEVGAHRWLFRVAYRRAISLRRHNGVLHWESLDAIEEDEDDVNLGLALSATPSSFEDQVVERTALTAALARLSSLDATCLLLHVVHGFSAAEVAQIIEVSPEAAKKRLWRATERLRTAYFARDGAPAGRIIRI
jgi:RNA polymerase sigma factor (sigma-70 family)